ncbi:MAG: ankyrin repeat domain-containing protein, partial [Bdellovibrionota bacterium]
IKAVKGGNYGIVQDLLNRGFDPNYRNKNGETALMSAAFFGNVAIAQLLISRGASVNVTGNASTENAIYWAIIGRRPDLRMLELLVRYANVQYRQQGMIEALVLNKLEASKIFDFYLKGADRKEYRQKAIMIAAERGHLTLMKHYAALVASLNAQNPDGVTPLMLAAKNGNVETAKYLLQNNVSLASWDKEGRTAATYAAEAFELELLQTLKKMGVDLNIRDIKKQTLLMRVAGAPHPFIYLKPKQKRMLDYLIRENNIDAEDSAGETALMKAIRGLSPAIIRQLIEACAERDITRLGFLAFKYAPSMERYLYPATNPTCSSRNRITALRLNFAITP